MVFLREGTLFSVVKNLSSSMRGKSNEWLFSGHAFKGSWQLMMDFTGLTGGTSCGLVVCRALWLGCLPPCWSVGLPSA